MSTVNQAHFSSGSAELMCCWRAWRVIGPKLLALNLDANHCCDMRRAIKLAKRLMPDVLQIHVYSGNVLDIAYIYEDGNWTARTPARDAA